MSDKVEIFISYVGRMKIGLRGENIGVYFQNKNGENKVIKNRELREALGPTKEEVFDENYQYIELNRSRREEIEEEVDRPGIIEEERENLLDEKTDIDERISELEKENEIIEDSL